MDSMRGQNDWVSEWWKAKRKAVTHVDVVVIENWLNQFFDFNFQREHNAKP